MATNKVFLDQTGLIQYDTLIKELINSQLGAEETRAKEAEQAEETRAKGVESDLLAAINTLAAGAVQSNTDAITVLNGDANTEGSVKKQVQDAVNSVVASAPEALDTLKEIADWIANDETGTAALVARVSTNETNIANNAANIATNAAAIVAANNDIDSLKGYVDAQDESYFNRIISINNTTITSLFKTPVSLQAGQTVNEVLTSLGENEKLVLTANSAVTEDITVPSGATLDANGSTLSGNITIANDAVVENATFTGKVTIQ